MKYDGVIFDIDGTLWDTTSASAEIWNLALQEYGVDKRVDRDLLASLMGKPFLEFFKHIIPEREGEFPAFGKLINKYFESVMPQAKNLFYDRVRERILELSKVYKLFLVSNCEADYLQVFLERSGFRSALAGYDCYGLSKELKERMLVNAQTKYNLANPVYIGDTDSDLHAAQSARMDFIHARYGFGQKMEGVVGFDSFAEIVEYLLGFR